MNLNRDIINEIISLCERISEGRANGSITQQTYSDKFKPFLDEFKNKFGNSPNLSLQQELALFYKKHLDGFGSKLNYKSFGFWGRAIYNYTWSCIYYDFDKEAIPASYSPQLYIVVNRFGIKFGFCYGNYIQDNDPLVSSALSGNSFILLKECFKRDNSLLFLNSKEEETTASPEKLFGPEEKITFKSENDIIDNWSSRSLLIKEFKKEEIPNNINEIIQQTFLNLKEFFLSILPNSNIKTFNGSKPSISNDPFNGAEAYIGINNSGLFLSNILFTRFVASLLTKPFVILTGLSGSGKTKLAQAFVQWICHDESQYRIIPVGADWTNREPLLGYPNALNPKEYVKPDSGVLDLIIRANNLSELPHFLILDEMNLSHVERYFADFLSTMESKEEIPLYAEGRVDNGVPPKLKVPSNLFIIGTVNIDETTNMFSPKVLDRANTIEFRVTQDEMQNFLGNIKDINMDALTGKGAGMAKSFLDMSLNKTFATKDVEAINQTLVKFFGELKKTGAEFGYRSATEILRLIHQLTVLDSNLSTNEKIDIAIMQKLLPKLHGSRRKLCPVLETLASFCVSDDLKIVKDVFENKDFDFNGSNVLYPLSLEKITRMYRGAVDNGFASFAEA